VVEQRDTTGSPPRKKSHSTPQGWQNPFLAPCSSLRYRIVACPEKAEAPPTSPRPHAAAVAGNATIFAARSRSISAFIAPADSGVMPNHAFASRSVTNSR